ncbi:MAG TPA: hypothetical protein VGL94_24295 [Ktedonobacteraceae bacterium]|jgi:hypothetical protein
MNTTFMNDLDHRSDTTVKIAALPEKTKEQSWPLLLRAMLQRISKMCQGYSWQPSPFMVIFLSALVFNTVMIYYGFMNFNAVLYILVIKYLPLVSH